MPTSNSLYTIDIDYYAQVDAEERRVREEQNRIRREQYRVRRDRERAQEEENQRQAELAAVTAELATLRAEHERLAVAYRSQLYALDDLRTRRRWGEISVAVLEAASTASAAARAQYEVVHHRVQELRQREQALIAQEQELRERITGEHVFRRNSYHGTSTPWRQSRELTGRHVGIELEVEATESVGSYTALMRLLPGTKQDDEEYPIVETDSTLDVDRGMEIIFPPIPYANLLADGKYFRRAVDALHGNIREATTNCGMHMNINVRDWTRRKKAAFIAVIHHMSDTQIRNLGGRAPTSYCRLSRMATVADYDGFSSSHTAAGLKADYTRLEVRFPRATANRAVIQTLIDFFTELEEWVDGKEDALFREEADAVKMQFMQYLSTQPADSRAQKVWLVIRNGQPAAA